MYTILDVSYILQMTSILPFTNYFAIHEAWNSNGSMNDIYHMILDWMQRYSPNKIYPETAEAVHDWLHRAERGDETNDLVEEFIYGEKYEIIRTCFGEPDKK